MDELEAVWNKTPMPNFQEEPRMLLKQNQYSIQEKSTRLVGSQTGQIYIIKRRYLKKIMPYPDKDQFGSKEEA